MQTIKAWLATMFSSQKEVSWRRLAVFAVATVLLCTGHLSQELWTAIAGGFITGEVVEKFASKPAALASGEPQP